MVMNYDERTKGVKREWYFLVDEIANRTLLKKRKGRNERHERTTETTERDR